MNNNEETINAERVRKLIREAFADVPSPETFSRFNACAPLTHEVALAIRENLYNFEPEEVRSILPSLLEDAIDNLTGDDIENDGIEMLVLQLDPFRIDNELIRVNSLQLFENFTLPQSEAVCEWLRLARKWKDLALYADCVDSGVKYWCSRCK